MREAKRRRDMKRYREGFRGHNNDKRMIEAWVMFTHRRGRLREMAQSPEAERRQQAEGSLCLRGEGEIEGY